MTLEHPMGPVGQAGRWMKTRREGVIQIEALCLPGILYIPQNGFHFDSQVPRTRSITLLPDQQPFASRHLPPVLNETGCPSSPCAGLLPKLRILVIIICPQDVKSAIS